MYNTTEKGNGIVAANSDVLFNSSLGSKTMRLFVNSKQQQVKATNPAVCSSNLYSFAWSADSKTITVTPRTALEVGKTYSVNVSTNAKNSSGARELTAPYTKVLTVGQQVGTREEGILKPGETWVSSLGASVTAPIGLLAEPVTIYVEKVDPTSLPVPFPANVTPVTDFLRIGSVTTPKFTPKSRTNFIIGINVRPNQMDSSLFLESLSSGSVLQPPRDGYFWSGDERSRDSTSIYETASTLFLQGSIYVIAKQKVVNLLRTQQISRQQQNIVSAACSPTNAIVGCNNFLQQYASATLTEIIRLADDVSVPQNYNLEILNNILLSSSTGDGCFVTAGAFFNVERRRITYCLQPNGTISTGLTNTIRHELYHVLQYYLSGDRNGFEDYLQWIIERTANAAELSTAVTMNIQGQAGTVRDYPRLVTTRFATPPTDYSIYQTQDFFVDVGRRANVGLGYLNPIFETGIESGIRGVANIFPNGLGNAYWAWAKNQGFERQDYGWNFADKCNPNFETLAPDYTFDSQNNFAGNEIVHSMNALTSNLQSANFVALTGLPTILSKHIAPLESRAIRIRFTNTNDLSKPQNQKPLRFSVKKIDGTAINTSSLRYKWYIKPKLAGNCGFSQENMELNYTPSKQNSQASDPEIFVLISNIDAQSANNIDRSATFREPLVISVQRITPTISVPSSIILKGNVGDTLTDTLTISNTGDLDSTLEYKQYFLSLNQITLPPRTPAPTPLAGAAARVQSVLPYPDEGELAPVGGDFLSPLASRT